MPPDKKEKKFAYINRELAWLDFNSRVLEQARRTTTNPPLERLRFLSITASNLDEFFMVRVGGLQTLRFEGKRRADPAGMTPARQLKAISQKAHAFIKEQYAVCDDIRQAREIEARLAIRGLYPQDLTAILISHHHSDHVRGIGPMSRRFGLPVYTLPATLDNCRVGNLKKICYFEKGRAFAINSLKVHAFDTPHDAVDSVGFVFEAHGLKIGFATDLGIVTNVVREHLRGCNLLIMEANHDVDMLMHGPYPWYLKQRVKSRSGHLSNEDCNAFLQEIMHDTLEHVVFAHLSETNNTPEKVREVMQPLFGGNGAGFTVAGQNYPTEIIIVRPKD